MRSIRGSLLLGTALGVVGTLLVAGAGLDRAIRAALLSEMDRSLRQEADALAAMCETTEKGLEVEFSEIDLPGFAEAEGPAYLELRRAGGEVLHRSESADELELSWPADAADGRTLVVDDVRVRAIAHPFDSRVDTFDDEELEAFEAIGGVPELASEPLVLLLARDMSHHDSLVATLRTVLASIGAATALIALFALNVTVRRGIRPLRSLARRLGAVDDDTLFEPIDVPAPPEELRPVVARLNEMLDRLHAAFQRERTFSADIAHELRTPLSGLRTSIEVGLSAPRDAAAYRETLETALDLVVRMQDMTDTLLHLARLESGQITPAIEAVDLVSTLARVWTPLAADADERGLTVEREVPERAVVAADRVLLETAIANILHNAVHHADRGGRVHIEVTNGAPSTTLRVVNSGSRVAADDVPRLFDRFVRGDQSRTDRHVGLGLSLVNRIAELLELTLDIRSEVGATFDVSLRARTSA